MVKIGKKLKNICNSSGEYTFILSYGVAFCLIIGGIILMVEGNKEYDAYIITVNTAIGNINDKINVGFNDCPNVPKFFLDNLEYSDYPLTMSVFAKNKNINCTAIPGDTCSIQVNTPEEIYMIEVTSSSTSFLPIGTYYIYCKFKVDALKSDTFIAGIISFFIAIGLFIIGPIYFIIVKCIIKRVEKDSPSDSTILINDKNDETVGKFKKFTCKSGLPIILFIMSVIVSLMEIIVGAVLTHLGTFLYTFESCSNPLLSNSHYGNTTEWQYFNSTICPGDKFMLNNSVSSDYELYMVIFINGSINNYCVAYPNDSCSFYADDLDGKFYFAILGSSNFSTSMNYVSYNTSCSGLCRVKENLYVGLSLLIAGIFHITGNILGFIIKYLCNCLKNHRKNKQKKQHQPSISLASETAIQVRNVNDTSQTVSALQEFSGAPQTAVSVNNTEKLIKGATTQSKEKSTNESTQAETMQSTSNVRKELSMTRQSLNTSVKEQITSTNTKQNNVVAEVDKTEVEVIASDDKTCVSERDREFGNEKAKVFAYKQLVTEKK